MVKELQALSDDLIDLANSLGATALEGLMTDLGVAAKKDVAEAVRADLGGDLKFSGWARFNLASGFEHMGPGWILLVARPRGPFNVAEHGRLPGSKHGRTPAKHTWTDAVDKITDETPKRAADGIYKLFKKAIT